MKIWIIRSLSTFLLDQIRTSLKILAQSGNSCGSYRTKCKNSGLWSICCRKWYLAWSFSGLKIVKSDLKFVFNAVFEKLLSFSSQLQRYWWFWRKSEASIRWKNWKILWSFCGTFQAYLWGRMKNFWTKNGNAPTFRALEVIDAEKYFKNAKHTVLKVTPVSMVFLRFGITRCFNDFCWGVNFQSVETCQLVHQFLEKFIQFWRLFIKFSALIIISQR